jgi:excisionase family DNA binding protein
MESLNPLMNTEQVAAYLHLNVKAVHELVRSGKLGCVQVTPKKRGFTREQVQEFIESRTIPMKAPVDRKPCKKIRCSPKGGERQAKRVSESGLLIREEIKKLCQ